MVKNAEVNRTCFKQLQIANSSYTILFGASELFLHCIIPNDISPVLQDVAGLPNQSWVLNSKKWVFTSAMVVPYYIRDGANFKTYSVVHPT